MDITRTMPADESPKWIRRLFDGTWKTATFPLTGVPRRCQPGDSLFLIYRGQVTRRFDILKIKRVWQTVLVGPHGSKRIEARCKIIVGCPGERPARILRRRGHQGFRYVRLARWRG